MGTIVTGVIVVIGVILVFKFLLNPVVIVAVIGGFVMLWSIKDHNGQWFDITQSTPQLIANPPQPEVVAPAPAPVHRAVRSAKTKAKPKAQAKPKTQSQPKATRKVKAATGQNPYTIHISPD